MAVRDDWVSMVSNLKVGRSGGKPALHKPLLTLMLLARAQRGESRVVPYAELRDPLADFIAKFSSSGKRPDPKLPFRHLASEGFWKVAEADAAQKSASEDAPAKRGAPVALVGEVPEPMWAALVADRQLVGELAKVLLDRFWEDGGGEVIKAVGLELK